MNYKETLKQRSSEVCKNIRNLRNEKNISQAEIADKIGMQQAGYNQLEKGKIKLSMEKLFEISDFFELPVTYFIDKNVQGLIDSLMENNIEMNKIIQGNKFVLDLPELDRSSYVDRLIEKDKEIKSVKTERELIKNLNYYLTKENNTAKFLLKKLIENPKLKKIINKNIQKEISEIINDNM